jgi:hypothetical protein
VRRAPSDPLIHVRNKSNGFLKDEEIAALLPAVQRQVTEHFRPVWGVGARLVFADGRVPRDAYRIDVYDVAKDKSDAGFYGYHFSPTGYPVASIFAEDDVKEDGSISVTLSHEILEMIVDPACNLYAHRSSGVGRPERIYFYEVCDAVQCRTYKIDGVAVCDFVHPEWFEDNWPDGSRRFDHLGLVGGPFHVLPGCYSDIYEAKRGAITIWGSNRVRRSGRHRLNARLSRMNFGFGTGARTGQ